MRVEEEELRDKNEISSHSSSSNEENDGKSPDLLSKQDGNSLSIKKFSLLKLDKLARADSENPSSNDTLTINSMKDL